MRAYMCACSAGNRRFVKNKTLHRTILCLGRVLDTHDEQDDAEGGRRDWEEDPLGFDTNPMLLRAMCMAFE